MLFCSSRCPWDTNETRSTDYDEADKLYFENINLEVILDIYQMEGSFGVLGSFGGKLAPTPPPNLPFLPSANSESKAKLRITLHFRCCARVSRFWAPRPR